MTFDSLLEDDNVKEQRRIMLMRLRVPRVTV